MIEVHASHLPMLSPGKGAFSCGTPGVGWAPEFVCSQTVLMLKLDKL